MSLAQQAVEALIAGHPNGSLTVSPDELRMHYRMSRAAVAEISGLAAEQRVSWDVAEQTARSLDDDLTALFTATFTEGSA